MRRLIGIILALVFTGCATSRKALLKALSVKEPQSANAVVIFDSTFVNVKKTGSYVKRHHVLVKILTMKGKADYASPSFTYTTKYGKVVVKKARVIKKNGKIVKVKKDNIKDVKVPAFDKFFLPNVRMVKIVFPDVEKGDAVEYVVEEIISNPPMEGEFDDMVIFESTEPVLSQYYEIALPQRLYYRIYNDKDGIIKFRHEGEKYVWYANDIEPLIREPLMPPLPDVAKKVLLSTVKSWKTWSRWYWNLTKDKFALNDTITSLMDSLLKDKPTRLDSIKSLFYYVSNNIRYVATTMNGKKAGYEPFPATKTFRQKYGVCRDKAALLVAMLRHIGVDAYPVLTNPMIKVEKEIKTDQFNHAIVAIKDKKGYIYLDPTAEDIPVFLPFYEQGKGVLVCTPEGEDLSYTPILPPDSNSAYSTQEIYVLEDGNMKGKSVIKGSIVDQQFRMMVKKIPPERLKSIFSMSLQALGNEASLDTIYYTDPDDFNTPFSITMEYSVKGFAIKKDNKIAFTLSGEQGNMFGGNPFSLEKRNYPIYLYVPISSSSDIIVHIPKGYVIKNMPASENLENDYVVFSIETKNKGDSIILRYGATYKKCLIPADKYLETKSLYDRWAKNLKTRFILEKQ